VGIGGAVVSFRSDLGNRQRVGIKSTRRARRIGQRIEPVDIVGIEDEAPAILVWIEADYVEDESRVGIEQKQIAGG